MLTTHLHQAPRLRIRGVTHVLSLYAFMSWTSTTVRLSIWHRQLQCRENLQTGTVSTSYQTVRLKHKNHAVKPEGNARSLF